ncbi:MAG: hypothetical protein ABIQ49_06160 [Gemmatimonadales bacterium]
MTVSDADLITHKATRECPIIEPHRRDLCELLRAREQRQRLAPPPKA